MEHRELEDGGLQGQQYQKGSATAGSCTAYLQLFAGWLVLNLLTFMMATVPHSAQFLDIEPGFNLASGHAESDRFVPSTCSVPNSFCFWCPMSFQLEALGGRTPVKRLGKVLLISQQLISKN